MPNNIIIGLGLGLTFMSGSGGGALVGDFIATEDNKILQCENGDLLVIE